MAKPKRKTPAPRDRSALSIFPMNLRVGDTFTDENGTWEIAERPTTYRGGKDVTVKIQRPGDPPSRRAHTWAAYERITVTRASRS